MKPDVVFAQTTQGSLHIAKGIPCQDASCAYVDESNRFAIVAVSDGHGDPTCIRSDRGAQFAVQAAADTLQEFAEVVLGDRGKRLEPNPLDELHVPGHGDDIVRRITDSMLSRWYDMAIEDAKDDPITPDELSRAGIFASSYVQGRDLEHGYGATLIAGLKIGNTLLLMQQGDGRCVVLHTDGTMSEPIPWDFRCHENVTTSLCDEDAAESVRHIIMNEDADKPAACLLMSDGVEDAFADSDGRWDWCRRLLLKLTETKHADTRRQDFEAYLADELPGFSENGSGDDISVSCVADMREIMHLRETLSRGIDRYALEQRMSKTREKISSMERMHDYLRFRAEVGTEEDSEAFAEYHQTYSKLEDELNVLQEEFDSMDSED